MRVLLLLLRESRTRLVAGVVISAASGAASTLLLALLNRMITDRELLYTAATIGGFVGLAVLVPVTRLASTYIMQRLGQGLVRDLRMSLGRRILATPLRRLEELGAPRLMASLTNDVGVISTSIVSLPVIGINGAIVIGGAIYLAVLAPALLALLAGVFAVGVAGYRVPLAAAMDRFKTVRRIQDVLLDHFRGLTEGAKELKLSRDRSRDFLASLWRSADEQCEEQVGANLTFAAAAAWGHLLVFLAIGGLLYGGSLVGVTDTATIVSFVVVLIYVIPSLQVVLDTLPRLGQARVAVERMEELGLSLAEEGGFEEEASVPRLEPPVGLSDELVLEGVTYAYGGGEHSFDLGPIDLTIRKGEILFLTGGNGSGKTTLAKVIAGFYTPSSGRILVDGREIDDASRPAYRESFAFVFYDFFLFPQLFGIPREVVERSADEYLELLELEHKVEVRDGTLTTTSLSQGQRRRLALLVAYLEDRDIYFFDEWAADQDVVFKELFYRQLLPDLRRRGKTVLVISHDDRYYYAADRIVEMVQGRIASCDDADEWLAARGLAKREPVAAG